MEIVRAAECLPEIMALVDDVFTGEQGIPQEMNPIAPDRQPVWWYVLEEGRIVAAAAAYCLDGEWHMGRIAVAKPARGRGIGTRLIRHALREIFDMGAQRVRMEARDATVRIVRRMGAEMAGEPFGFYGANVTPVVVEKGKFC